MHHVVIMTLCRPIQKPSSRTSSIWHAKQNVRITECITLMDTEGNDVMRTHIKHKPWIIIGFQLYSQIYIHKYLQLQIYTHMYKKGIGRTSVGCFH